MRSSLLIISPDFPPRRGGVADHTRRLAQELRARLLTGVLTSTGGDLAAEYPVHPEITDWRDVDQVLTAVETIAPAAHILWQYVPHMYGRGGVNPHMPDVMRFFLKRHCTQMVIAHEIAAPLSVWPHRLWYALAQRRQWRRIILYADLVGIATEAWFNEWTRRKPALQRKLFLLPSPSSLPLLPLDQEHPARWRAKHGVPAEAQILTFFGSPGAAKQFPWVLHAWQAAQREGPPVALVVIGDEPEIRIPPGLAALYKPLGYLVPGAVSAALLAADVLALPFVDGVSERRTSFMSGLQHGCAIATTIGHNTGPTLRRADFAAFAPARNQAAFRRAVLDLLQDAPRRLRLRTAAREAYARYYDWPQVTDRIISALQNVHQE